MDRGRSAAVCRFGGEKGKVEGAGREKRGRMAVARRRAASPRR